MLDGCTTPTGSGATIISTNRRGQQRKLPASSSSTAGDACRTYVCLSCPASASPLTSMRAAGAECLENSTGCQPDGAESSYGFSCFAHVSKAAVHLMLRSGFCRMGLSGANRRSLGIWVVLLVELARVISRRERCSLVDVERRMLSCAAEITLNIYMT